MAEESGGAAGVGEYISGEGEAEEDEARGEGGGKLKGCGKNVLIPFFAIEKMYLSPFFTVRINVLIPFF